MTRSTRTVAAVSVAVAVIALVTPVHEAAAESAPRPALHPASAARDARLVGRLIVRTKDGRTTTASVRDEAASVAGVPSAAEVRRLGDGSHLVALSRPVSLDDARAAARAIAARPDVLWAEPDTWLYPSDEPLPNDPLVGSQWDLSDAAHPVSAADYSLHTPAAWSRTRGSRAVVVAVIDTGITAHPDLVGQTVPGYDFVSLDPVLGADLPLTANDGNGRDPDPSDPGDWITAADDAGLTAGRWFQGCGGQYPDGHSDSSWHGTHVAGTIAALQGNGVGISGLAPGVLVEPVRALGKCGGATSDIIDAIEWASGGVVAGVPANPYPAAVINMSLGGPGTCDAGTQRAVSDARARGSVVVVAAGNDGKNFTTPGGSSIPASCNGVVDVVATTRAGSLATYSNFGVNANPASGSVTVAAPGGDPSGGGTVLSTVNQGTTVPTVPGYGSKAGTSMATPHASAAVALLQSTRAGRGFYSPDQVASLLGGLTQPVVGCPPTACGLGLLDLALPMAAQVPLPVSGLQATQGDQRVDLSWAPTPDNPGDAVTYAVDSSDGTAWVPVQAAGVSAATSLAVTGLTNLTAYSFRVTAVDSLGASTPVQIDGVVPTAHAVQGVTATGGIERIAVTWTPPADMTGVTEYTIAFRPAGAGAWTTATAPVPATSTTVSTWPQQMVAGAWEVRVSADGPAFGPSTTALVTGLAQTVATSTRILRPYVDRLQDNLVVVPTTNVPATGLLRIYNARGVVVRALWLPLATTWKFTWNGTDQHRLLVPPGRYRVGVWLSGRTAELRRVGALRPVTVLASQAARPSIELSSQTVYPARDGYLDSITIRTTAVVPSTMVWKLTSKGKVVWTRAFPRRTTAVALFVGKSSRGAQLPAGAYVLTAFATGGEGITVARAVTLVVSLQRVGPSLFSITVPASSARAASTPGVVSGSVGGSMRIPGDGEFVSFVRALPASARPVVGLRATVCSHATQPTAAGAEAGYFTGDAHAPNFGVAARLFPGCTLVGGSGVPRAAVYDGAVHFFVTTSRSTSVSWQVDTVTLTGTRYVPR